MSTYRNAYAPRFDHEGAPAPIVGDVVHLATLLDVSRGSGVLWTCQAAPYRLNQSHAPRLSGWCGTTNGISTTAHGRGVIVHAGDYGAAVAPDNQRPVTAGHRAVLLGLVARGEDLTRYRVRLLAD